MTQKLVNNWMAWNIAHKAAMDGIDGAARESERLIERKYVLIAEINKGFENAIARTGIDNTKPV